MTSCLILAAGEGSRLRPLTDDKPKCLVSLIGKTIIQHQIDILKKNDVSNIAIVTGYKSKKIKNLGYKTFHNFDYNKTNMVESLFTAKEFLKNSKEDLLISYGDIVFESKNLKKVLNCTGDLVIMIDDGWLDLWKIRFNNPLDDAETLRYGSKNRIIEIGNKAKSLKEIEGQYTGLIKISYKKIQDFISFYEYKFDQSLENNDNLFKKIYFTDLLQLLIHEGWDLTPARVNHGWLEVDTINDLNIYRKLNDNGKLDFFWKPNA